VTGTGSDPLRVAVLGTGAISQVVHLPILVEREDVDVVGVSDEDEHKARTIAGRFGVRRVARDEELLGDEAVEAVVICTPNHLHERLAVAALERGKHVLVERPLALSPEGAERVLEAGSASGRHVLVGMYHRFRPDVAALRSFVAGGELGRITSVRGLWLNRATPLARATWRQRPEEGGGGALMDLGVQALDLCLWIAGFPEARRVVAVTHRGDHAVEDSAGLLVELAGGVTLTVEVSWALFASEDRRHVRVLGTEGSGTVPPLEIFKQLGGRPLEVTPRQPRPRGGEGIFTNAYRREIDNFLRAVRGEVDPPPPREQVGLMRLVQAAYRSAAEGREVVL